MRFIKTTQAQVDALKKKAKALQRNGGGKHTALLGRVARGAGYDHWHHVKLCLAETEGLHKSRQLLPEIEGIIQAALDGNPKIVRTGPEASTSQPFVLLATDDGDAWMLHPEEDKAMCLAWHGVRQDFTVRDLPTRIEILWHGSFALNGLFFTVQTRHPGVGSRHIAGYPVADLRQVLDGARSADRRIDQIFGQEDAVALTPEIIRHLVGQGWEEAGLVEAARDGARYSPSRNTLLYPPVAGDVG
jgi:hypothetical protein